MRAGGSELMSLIAGAVAPWNSIDADFPLGTHDNNADDQEQIDRCLNCTYADCIECLTKQRSFYDEDPLTVNIAQLNMCITLGMNQKDTCQLMGISKSSYYRAKRKLNGGKSL